MEADQNIPEHVHYLLELITDQFSPSTREEATIRKTTRQIYEELQETLPAASFTQEQLFMFLYEKGYRCDGNGMDFEFVWLMRPKNA